MPSDSLRSSFAVALSLCFISACGSSSGSSAPDDDTGLVSDDGVGDTDDSTDSGLVSDGALADGALADGALADGAKSDTSPSTDTGPGVDATPPPTGAISIVVLPDDGKTLIVDVIKAATKSIHLEMYLLTDSDVIDALISAKKAGRDVKVLLEKSPYPVTTENQAAHDSLAAGGVSVSYTTGLYTLTHSKLMIIDAAKAYVMTCNFTSDGVRYNREYAAVDSDATDVAEAEQLITADIAGTVKPKLTGGLLISPVNARASIASLIDAATKTIDIEIEEIADTTMIGKLEAAVAKGITVRLLVPDSPDSSTATALAGMKSRGIVVRTLGVPDVHAKAIVVDGARLYVGSVNLSKASMDYNREVGVITANAAALTRVATTIASDFSKGTPF